MRALTPALVMSAVLLGAACGGAPAATPSETVTATLTDTAIRVDQPSVPAGTVTFKAMNSGSVLHTLILLKTEAAADKIPADPKDASRVDTAGELRETAQIPVGASKEFSLKLAAGSYVLICNEPGHYLIGMHTPFTVK